MFNRIVSRLIIVSIVCLSISFGSTVPHASAGVLSRTAKKVVAKKAAQRSASKIAAKKVTKRAALKSSGKKIVGKRIAGKAVKKMGKQPKTARPLFQQIINDANKVAAKGGRINRSQQTALMQNLPVVKRRGVKANRVMRSHFSSTAKNNTNSKKRIIRSWEKNREKKWPLNKKGRSASLHHIVPLESGGANKWWNAMPTYGKAPNHSLKGVAGPHAKGGILRKTIQGSRKKMLQKGANGKVSGQYKEWDLRTSYSEN